MHYRPTVIQLLVGALERAAVRFARAFLRWLWRTDHVSRWGAVLLLAPFPSLLASSLPAGLGELLGWAPGILGGLLVAYAAVASVLGGRR